MIGIAKALLRQRWGMLSIFVLVVVAGFLLAISLPPTFRASALLSVELPGNPTFTETSRFLEQQRSILMSPEIAHAVAEKTRFTLPAARSSSGPTSFRDGVAWVAGLLNWRNWVADPLDEIDPATLSEAERRGLRAKALLAGFDLQVNPYGPTLQLSYQHEKAATAARISNAFADLYIRAVRDGRLPADSATRSGSAQALERARQSVTDARAAMTAYREEPDTVARIEKTRADAAELKRQQQALQAAQRERDALSERYAIARHLSASSGDTGTIARTFDDDTIRGQAARLAASRSRVAELEARMTAQHPSLQAASRLRDSNAKTLDALLVDAKRALSAQLGAAQARVDGLTASIAELETSIDGARAGDSRFQGLKLALESAERRLAALAPPAGGAAAGDAPIPTVQIIEKAYVPTQPISPDRVAIMLNAVWTGLGLGLLFGLIRDRSRRTA